tara:strand:+ start:572 stop:748 length:177 start_codon:yes stop_codon:yes gene_type:complete
MNKSTLIVTTVTMARPWWLFPGYETLQECASCYALGHLISLPIGLAIGVAIYWLLGGR